MKPNAATDTIGTKMFRKLSIQKNSDHKEENIQITSKLYDKKETVQNFEKEKCLHCKNAFNKNQINQIFCCNGCANVYQFLISNDLSKYYEIMQTIGQSPVTAEEFNESHYSIYQDENLNSIFKFGDHIWGFFVPEVKCAACIWLIEKSLQRYENISDININLLEKTITFSNKKQDPYLLKNVAMTLTRIGYNPLPLPFMSSKQFRSAYEKERIKDIGISGFAFGNVMIFAASSYFGKYFGIDQNINNAFIIISMLISVPATMFAGRSFFINSLHAMKNKKIHIDTTISFALIISLIVSIYETFLNSSKVYFDTITGLVFLLLVGRYFHEKALHKAKELGESIKNILPIEAFAVNKGDKLLIPAGSIFLADGVIVEGETEVNQASLTGEELPVLKKVDDQVLAGAQNILNPVKILAQKTGNETWIASLENLIQQAKNKKSNVETLIEKILPLFTISIIGVSFLAFFYWIFISWQKAIDVLVAILIISCPCALALATPLLMSATLKKLWAKGAIVKTQNSIEAISEIDTVIFDKTGTLTSGDLKVLHYDFHSISLTESEKNYFISAIFSLAKNSLHLVAKAVVNELQQKNLAKIHITNLKEIAGKGIEGKTPDGAIIKLGNLKFIDETMPDSDERFCVYGSYRKHKIKFILSEEIKAGSKELIQYFQGKKLRCLVLSGDRFSSVSKIAQLIGIPSENCFASLLPEEKLKILIQLQEQGKKVLAVGDGVNDAAMLAKSHVGIASHGGTDIALQSADIFLRKPSLFLLQEIFEMSKYAKKTLRILIYTSLLYNLVAIGFAFFGFVDPLFAAIFMPISSLSVFLIVYFRNGNSA